MLQLTNILFCLISLENISLTVCTIVFLCLEDNVVAHAIPYTFARSAPDIPSAHWCLRYNCHSTRISFAIGVFKRCQ